jgi:hypothetical protein
MEGILVRRSTCRFNLEHLEDRLTPSSQGALGLAAPIHTETLFVDWSSRVNATVLNYSFTFKTSEITQISFRVDMPVFSIFEFQASPSVLAPSSSSFGGQATGAFGNGSSSDSPLVEAASIASTSSSTGSSSQASSLAKVSTNPTTPPVVHQPVVVQPIVGPVQNNPNPVATTVQTSQVSNAAVSFVAGSQLRAIATASSGASDSAASELLKVFPVQTELGAPAVNPRAVTNPIPTPLPKLTPLPQSGGGDTVQPEEKVMPPAADRAPGEQQQSQDLQELGGAALSAAFVPDNPTDAASALALVGDFDAPSALSQVQLLLVGVLAASAIGVAHRRNKTEEAERELLEGRAWLPRPLVK